MLDVGVRLLAMAATLRCMTARQQKQTIPKGTILGIQPSLVHSFVQVADSSVVVGSAIKVTIFLHDSTNAAMVAKRYPVKLTVTSDTSGLSGTVSTVQLSELVNQNDGSCVAELTGVTPGCKAGVTVSHLRPAPPKSAWWQAPWLPTTSNLAPSVRLCRYPYKCAGE